MNEDELEQEPVFPMTDFCYNAGMSKRFYAACSALQGILSSTNPRYDLSDKDMVKAAYEYADELLKQEKL